MKILRNSILALLLGVILEVGYFQFDAFFNSINPQLQEKQYTLADMTPINWSEAGVVLTSQLDPALIVATADQEIYTLDLEFITSIPLDSVTVYYVNEQNPQITEATVRRVPGPVQSRCRVKINAPVKEMRIDLGELADVELYGLTVTTNSHVMDLSVSRIVAVLLIYLLGTGLFALQRMPDYKLERIQKQDGKQDE